MSDSERTTAESSAAEQLIPRRLTGRRAIVTGAGARVRGGREQRGQHGRDDPPSK
jgi:hypothetical protein